MQRDSRAIRSTGDHMRPHWTAEEDEHNGQQFFDAGARVRSADVDEGAQDNSADANRRTLPVACIRQKISGNRKSPREPAKVKTRPTSNSQLAITSLNDRPFRQLDPLGIVHIERAHIEVAAIW